MDDVNYLLFRKQVSQLRADEASTPESRAAHQGLVELYDDQLRAVRDRNRILALAADTV